MTQQDWENMTSAERYTYLTTNDLEVVKQMGVPGNSKVSDVRVVVHHFGKVGDVNVAGPCESVEDVYNDTAETIKAHKAEALLEFGVSEK